MTDRPSSMSCRSLLDSLVVLGRNARRQGLGSSGGCSNAAVSLLSLSRELGSVRACVLAAHLQVDNSAVSRRLHSLEQAGLVERIADPADGRAQLVRITERGRTLLDQRRDSASVELSARLTGWRDHDVIALADLLRRLDRSLGVLDRQPV